MLTARPTTITALAARLEAKAARIALKYTPPRSAKDELHWRSAAILWPDLFEEQRSWK
ncbi:hypothetical protein [Altericroceibacterium endophyticum]|uniref:Uncharacterized protein n=1 Tax=Altericroceibacterium endophyticum TaxID=1808508 RepID=A0A6I4T2N5_9SPHN|nr:hypothetical protein [Altericroceibacterium endophyticum]MXO65494.1 hypothetical protein [Altericroceibacterium endophyticum]